MGDEFRLSHAGATTEKAVEAAARVEEIVGAVINGNRKAWARIDVEDVALLVQHARSAARPAASPDWMSKMAVETLAARAEAAEAALKQAQDDGRLMLASMGSDMWRRLDGAGRTRLEQELDRSLRDSTEDDGERVPYAELYAYRRLLALGDFFDNPRRESPPVAALPEPEWYAEREADDEDEDEDCDEDEDGADDGNDDASRAVARWEVGDGDR